MPDAGLRPWLHEPLCDRLLALPSMLTDEERQYLIWLTRTCYTGAGAIVDLGPWLGASTASLAEGLERGGHAGRIESLDLFRWERSYMQCGSAPDLEEGADFQPWFQRMISPWSERVVAAKTDLMHHRWTGGPIEILFVDAAKSWELTRAILANFGPHLIPGVTRIVLQDFADSPTYFLPLVFDSVPQVFRQAEAVANGTTVTFLVEPDADVAAVAATCVPEQFPLPRVTAIMRRRAAAYEGLQRSLYLGALCHRSAEELESEDLDALEAEIRVAFPAVSSERMQRYRDASCRLVSRGWAAIQAGDLELATALARRAVQQAPGQLWSWSLAACVALRHNHREVLHDAIAHLQQHPDHPDYLIWHAEACVADGNLLQAEADLIAAVVLFSDRLPAMSWALGLLSSVLRRQGRPSRAWHVVERLPFPQADNVDLLLLRGEIAVAAGHNAIGSRCCERVLGMEPTNARAGALARQLGSGARDVGS